MRSITRPGICAGLLTRDIPWPLAVVIEAITSSRAPSVFSKFAVCMIWFEGFEIVPREQGIVAGGTGLITERTSFARCDTTTRTVPSRKIRLLHQNKKGGQLASTL